MEVKTFKKNLAGKEIIVETGKMANQANGSVTVQYGDTVVLATAVMSDNIREGINYFPLMVDYEERLYAAGKIKGSRFIKREGRPTDEAILSGRMVDRTIRPLFNGRIRNDIQVVLTILSVDQENDPDICSLIGASLALAISDIPWDGPIGAVRVAKIDGELIVNPTYEQRDKSSFDVIIAGKDDQINMIEGGGNEVAEDEVLEKIKFSQKCVKEIINFQKEIIAEIGKEKKEAKLIEADKETEDAMRKFLAEKLSRVVFAENKNEKQKESNQLREDLHKFIEEKFGDDKTLKYIADLVTDEEIDALVHKAILEENKRPDKRSVEEIRKISAQVGLLPRTHGSGLFNRGETQALTVATLGSPGDEQTLDSMEEDGTKRFMHHYTFPSFSVGETGPMRGPGRREIGHGALAEKALQPLVPQDKEKFPYTIRLVSEILSSNGSSSMASVCGSSLALMDAGVFIPRPVAGIAMGLISDDNGNHKILTDIQGYEDHHGDMDFKVAGTEKGITAMQMDVKVAGITLEIVAEVLSKAKEARMKIIETMNEAISESRADLSKYAPRITTMKINPEKIKDVIGPGGKMINEIIAETGVAIDIEDDGLVMITSKDAGEAKRAEDWIKDLTREIVAGEIFQGKVVRIMNFGAFVELLPGQDGLVHISELAPNRVEKVEDVVNLGDVIAVKVKEVDDQGRISLTHKGV
ncbi:polyribonucleotide nucleotidyltransferase [Candidatus Parcubacteria bacterium]|nr:polyribonucleotide nucleotidyltransferase [Candidatus Parcubacteria bacterium]